MISADITSWSCYIFISWWAFSLHFNFFFIFFLCMFSSPIFWVEIQLILASFEITGSETETEWIHTLWRIDTGSKKRVVLPSLNDERYVTSKIVVMKVKRYEIVTPGWCCWRVRQGGMNYSYVPREDEGFERQGCRAGEVVDVAVAAQAASGHREPDLRQQQQQARHDGQWHRLVGWHVAPLLPVHPHQLIRLSIIQRNSNSGLTWATS